MFEPAVALIEAALHGHVGDTKAHEKYAQPVRCPCGGHLIFVRESGNIVEHLDADGSPCAANGKKFALFEAGWVGR